MKTAEKRHPDPLQIERFLRGETSRAENRALVRHLVHGCLQCQMLAHKSLAAGLRESEGGRQPPRRRNGLPTKSL